MTTYRAQVVIPYFTNLPQDVITNTLYFEDFNSVPFATVADTLSPIIESAYTGIYNGVAGLGANYVNWGNAEINWYDLSEPEPRTVENRQITINVATPVATVIPTEVAVVLSFQALPAAGQPQARRRGRIFLGGLGDGWFDASTVSTFPELDFLARNNLAERAEFLRDAVIGEDMTWRVWSPTTSQSHQVADGWIDNSPDTQRRRSVDSTSRLLWPAP